MKDFLARTSKLGPYLWALMALLFLTFNQNKLWTDSELWPVIANRLYFSDSPNYFFGIKPLFHFFLWANTKIAALLSLHPLVTARLFAGLNALVILILCDQILLRFKASGFQRLFFQLLIWSCSTFLFRSGEVRSDLFVTSIFLSAILFLYSDFSVTTKRNLLVACVSVSLLFSAKAFFWWLAGLPIILPIFKNGKTACPRRILSVAFALMSGIILLFFFKTFKNSGGYFLNNFDSSQMGFSYFSMTRLEHILRFSWQNIHLLIFILGTLLWSFRKGIHRINLSVLLFLLLLVTYPDPLPFFLASLIPIICLLTFCMMLGLNWSMSRWAPFAVGLIVIFGMRVYDFQNHNNFGQRSVVSWVQENLVKPYLLVYDPAGLVSADNFEYWFIGPGERNFLDATVENISVSQVDVFLYSQKGLYLEPKLSELLDREYIQYGKSIYVRALDAWFLQKMPCEKQIDYIYSFFDRQMKRGASLYFREFDEVNDHTTEIQRVDERLCKIKLDKSTPNMRSVILPVWIKDPPKENFIGLFAYDSYF